MFQEKMIILKVAEFLVYRLARVCCWLVHATAMGKVALSLAHPRAVRSSTKVGNDLHC